MSWSLGETRALAIKAARGIGMPWGMAEETGQAIEWLHSSDLPGVTALQNLLCDYERDGLLENWAESAASHWTDSEFSHCPIALGVMVSDASLERTERALKVCYPLLLLPFLATKANHVVLLKIDGEEIEIHKEGVDSSKLSSRQTSTLLGTTASCHWQQVLEDKPLKAPHAHHSRVTDGFAADIKRLESLAALTYAPATEESRLRGAGAGLSDND